MKTWLFVIGAFILLCALLFGASYNSLVGMRESVNEKWAYVERVYQRRLDVIPTVEATVKGYLQHERQMLAAVTDACAMVSRTTIGAGSLSDERRFKAFAGAQDALSSALSQLLAAAQRNSTLKASRSFLSLQSRLEEIENKMGAERRRFNEAVRDYNAALLRYPMNMVASMFKFTKAAYFRE